VLGAVVGYVFVFIIYTGRISISRTIREAAGGA
jgi:hypothetical protein